MQLDTGTGWNWSEPDGSDMTGRTDVGGTEQKNQNAVDSRTTGLNGRKLTQLNVFGGRRHLLTKGDS